MMFYLVPAEAVLTYSTLPQNKAVGVTAKYCCVFEAMGLQPAYLYQ